MSKRRLFAFIVGIDHFLGAGNLNGCVNDAKNFKQYLEESIHPKEFDLQIKTLFDEGATREAILTGMRDHFYQANKEDIALFFFAGHGSEELAHPYFNYGRQGGKLQTLVCHDSRSVVDGKKVRDIADKEIRYLLHKVKQQTGADIIVLQDSCHSGGATRSAEDKQELEAEAAVPRFTAEKGISMRTVEDFILIEDEKERKLIKEGMEYFDQLAKFGKPRGASKEPDHKPFQEVFPEAPHVHISACNEKEYAYEVQQTLPDGRVQKGGVFTHNLIQILRATAGDISYQSLCNRIMLNIQGLFKQTPMAYAAVDESLVFRSFLDNKNENKKARYSVFCKERRGEDEWLIDAGAIAGVAIPTGKQFIDGVEVVSHDGEQRYAAEIERVFAEKSFLRFKKDTPPKEGHYYALIPQNAFYRSSVKVWIDPAGIKHPFAAYLEQQSPFQSEMSQYAAGASSNDPVKQHDHLIKQKPKAEASYEIRFEEGGLCLYEGENCLVQRFDVGQEDCIEIITQLRILAKEKQQEISFYVPEELEENPMLSIFEHPGASVYHPFIRRVEEKGKAQYWLSAVNWKKESDSPVSYYGYQISKKNDDFPLVAQTDDLGKTAAFTVLSYFENIANWRRARYLFNPTAMDSMQDSFPLKVDFKLRNAKGGQEAFELHEDKVPNPKEAQAEQAQLTKRSRRVSKTERLEEFLLHIPSNYFNPKKELDGDYGLSFSVDVRRRDNPPAGQGAVHPNRPLYWAALLLDETFGIKSVTEGGVQPISTDQTLPVVYQSQANLYLSLPDYALSEAFQAKEADDRQLSQYMLFLVGYNRFDIAPLQQESLPAPQQPKTAAQQRLEELQSMLRGVKSFDPGESEAGWSSLMLCLRYDVPKISSLIEDAEERVAMDTSEEEEWDEDFD